MRLYGKEAPAARVAAFSRSGRFPHALMFCGDRGVGRGVMADHTAALLLCEKGGDEPCMSCSACRKVFGHIHPDVVYPLKEAEGGKYKVEQLRAFTADCCKTPNDGALRVCVFEDMDEMSVICQNTLLKFIEEPLPFNRCIFTAQRRSAVLETVLSRVTCVDVEEAGREACIAALIENGLDSAKAAEMYGLFGGNIGKCLEGAADDSAALLLKTAGNIAEALCASREYDCAVSFSSLKTRDDIAAVLSLLCACFADAAALINGVPPRGALAGYSKKAAEKFSLKTVTELYEALSSLSNAAEHNPNAALYAAQCSGRLFTAIEKGM